MKCYKCGNKDCELDKISRLYYCNKCKRLFDEEEEYTGLIGLLDSVAIIMVHFMLCIPFINFIIAGLITKDNVGKVHAKHIGAHFISSIFVWCFILVYSGLGVSYFNNKVITDNASIPVSQVNIITAHDFKWKDALSSKVIDYTKNNITCRVQERFQAVSPLERYYYLDEAIITGEVAREMVTDSKDMKLTYLIQTQDIVRKRGEGYYRNVGRILDICVVNENDDKYYCKTDCNGKYSIATTDTGNDIVNDEIEDLFKDGYIYNINPSKEYQVHILKGDNKEIIGFAFEEY